MVLRLRSNTFKTTILYFENCVMSELSSNSCYEYLHIVTLAATRSDNLVATISCFDHNIMSKLAGYTCYEYFQISIVVSGSLLPYLFPYIF